MAESRAGKRRLGSIAVAVSCLAVAGAVGWSFFGKQPDSQASAVPGDFTASIGAAPSTLGPSGLPIPRFVSLKKEKVNVRRGPSSDHPVAWVFQRKGLPVEIVAEFDNWRRIRDSDGEEGWILRSLLTGKRTAVVAPWREGQTVPLYGAPNDTGGLVAKVGAGTVGFIDHCTGQWCEVTIGGYDGWFKQTML